VFCVSLFSAWRTTKIAHHWPGMLARFAATGTFCCTPTGKLGQLFHAQKNDATATAMAA
jgi:hypothetical protein